MYTKSNETLEIYKITDRVIDCSGRKFRKRTPINIVCDCFLKAVQKIANFKLKIKFVEQIDLMPFLFKISSKLLKHCLNLLDPSLTKNTF